MCVEQPKGAVGLGHGRSPCAYVSRQYSWAATACTAHNTPETEDFTNTRSSGSQTSEMRGVNRRRRAESA